MKADSELLRTRAVKGFAFRDHTDQELAAIRRYLDTGDPAALDGTGYRAQRDGWWEDMPARKR